MIGRRAFLGLMAAAMADGLTGSSASMAAPHTPTAPTDTSAAPAVTARVDAGTPGRDHIGRRFHLERLRYKCGFLFFTHAADAEIRFEMKPNGRMCQVWLWGRTRGVIGFFTEFRQDHYVADMELVDGGRRLLSRQVYEKVIVGSDRDEKVTIYDQEKRMVIEKQYDVKTGKVKKVKQKPMPKTGYCDDYLTAFYNFRQGVYGPIRPGAKFHIQSNPLGKVKTVEIEIGAEQEAKRRRPVVRHGLDYFRLLKVKLGKKFLRSRTGTFEGWLAKDGTPVGAVIPGMSFFGDVWGYLVKKDKFKPGSPGVTSA